MHNSIYIKYKEYVFKSGNFLIYSSQDTEFRSIHLAFKKRGTLHYTGNRVVSYNPKKKF